MIHLYLIQGTDRGIDEAPPEDDGFIEPSRPREEVRQDSYPLPKDFEWSVIDIEDTTQVFLFIILVLIPEAGRYSEIDPGGIRASLRQLC